MFCVAPRQRVTALPRSDIGTGTLLTVRSPVVGRRQIEDGADGQDPSVRLAQGAHFVQQSRAALPEDAFYFKLSILVTELSLGLRPLSA